MSVDCVLLAAGRSARIGRNKLLLDLGGRCVIERCMDAFAASCERIIVVTGPYHEDIRQCLSPYPKVQIVYHADAQAGMFSSVKAGVRHVKAARFFITPSDYPLLKAATVRHMLNSAAPIAAPVYMGRQGHPVLLDKLLIPDILTSSCVSLRDCLQDMPAERCAVPVDDIGTVTDIDTMAEYNALLDSVCGNIPNKIVQNNWQTAHQSKQRMKKHGNTNRCG